MKAATIILASFALLSSAIAGPFVNVQVTAKKFGEQKEKVEGTDFLRVNYTQKFHVDILAKNTKCPKVGVEVFWLGEISGLYREPSEFVVLKSVKEAWEIDKDGEVQLSYEMSTNGGERKASKELSGIHLRGWVAVVWIDGKPVETKYFKPSHKKRFPVEKLRAMAKEAK